MSASPIDFAAHLGAMSRSVKATERDGHPAKSVILSRVYDTDAADLWDVLTNPERLPRWFAPVTGDLRLGGRYQVQGNAGGTVTACEPHRHFALTWEFGGGVSWVAVRLTPEGTGTRLELEHTAPLSPHWDQFGPGAVGVGWDLSFLGISLHLHDPSAERPDENTWAATPEAKDFIRVASADWGRADIAGGAGREAALAAAEATRKFYTGEAPPPGS